MQPGAQSKTPAYPASMPLKVSRTLKHEVFVMARSDAGDWSLRVLDEPAQPGLEVLRSDVFSLLAFPFWQGATSWISSSQLWGT